VTLIFAIAQWRSIGNGRAVQNVTAVAKAAAFVAVIAAALTWGPDAPAGGSAAGALNGWALATAFLLSLQSVIYTYDGWTAVVYFSEEVRDAGRDVPRALIGGVLLVVAIYLLTNAALLEVLAIDGLRGDAFALGTVAERLAGPYGMTAMLVVAIVSLLSAVNANHLMASRVLFAMGRDGLFAARAADVNAGGTPAVALGLSALTALLFIIFGRTFGQVITVLSFFFVANYSLSFISLFVLRAREPDRARPYRAWGYPWTTALALVGSIAFLAGAVAGDTRHSLFALLLLAASYPVYRLRRGGRGPVREAGR
jgi:basic amino acid/polyamine antiporter, APA family